MTHNKVLKMDATSTAAGLKQSGRNHSPWIAVFNMCNAAIGSGVLSFPYAFRQTGIFGGLFYTGIIWLVEVGALLLLIRTAEKYKTKSYQDLVVALFGPSMAIVTSITILVFLGGSLVSYFIITGDVFEPIFIDWFGENSLFADRRLVIVFFAILVVLPLSLKRSLRDLKWSSTISVTMLTYLTVTLGIIGVAKFLQEGFPQQVNFFRGGMHALIAVDIVVFSFHCHIQVMPILGELADEPNPFFNEGWNWGLHEPLLATENEAPILQKGSRRVKCMDGVIIISMTTCFICYCLVGEFGYLLFPDVESDVLKSFGGSNPFINFSRIGMAVVSMVCYPVCHYPCRTILEDATRYVLQGRIKEGFSWTLHVILTLVLCGAALGTSLLTSDLGTVFSIVGSTGGVLVVFIIPGMILIRNKLGEHRLTPVLQDTEAPLHGDKVVHARDRAKYIRIVGGSVLVCFGFLIFLITAYITVKGKENV